MRQHMYCRQQDLQGRYEQANAACSHGCRASNATRTRERGRGRSPVCGKHSRIHVLRQGLCRREETVARQPPLLPVRGGSTAGGVYALAAEGLLAAPRNAQPSQAHPLPALQVFERSMQVSPHALPSRQILQHSPPGPVESEHEVKGTALPMNNGMARPSMRTRRSAARIARRESSKAVVIHELL